MSRSLVCMPTYNELENIDQIIPAVLAAAPVDLLIIDEGFGALDAMNVEACNRLLESLKRWFQHILVISHVDAVKDVVDNVIDITRKSKNSHVYVE